MKPKSSPTSPKAKSDNTQNKDLDNYYKNSLSNIEKPKKQRTPIWFLFLVIIFGFLAGILGQLVLLSYGSEIPYLDKLDIFSLTEEQPFFISLGNKQNNSVIEVNKILENEKNSIVQIFDLNNSTDPLNSMYIPANQLGLALAITNDGYLITTNQVIKDLDSEYVAITEAKEIYLINEIITDPATDFLLLKTDINNLNVPTMSDFGDISNSEEILLLIKNGFNRELQTQIINIKDINYQEIKSSVDYFNSTEKLNQLFLLDSSEIFNNSVAYGNDGQAIGITGNVNGSPIIYPFYLIENKISSTLENGKLIRPYVGISYINLANTANISSELSQNSSKGALIYFDEDGNFPGIIKNSPAEKAGLQSEDIILTINNQAINGENSLNMFIQAYNAGDVINFNILREGIEQEIKLTLESII